MTTDSLSRKLAGFVALTSLVAACGPSDEEVRAKQQVTELQAELKRTQDEYGAKVDKLSAQNAALATRLKAKGENVESLQANLDETTRALNEMRERERQQELRLKKFRDVMAKFRAMVDAGKLRVRVARNRLVVELPESILFDSGKSELKKGGKEAIGEVANILKQIPDREFQIAGHTDNVPIKSAKFPSNWELSTARAVNVLQSLIQDGMNPQKMSAAGHADTQPVDTNDSKEGRAKNRRIDIVLMPNLDELPDLSSLETTK